MRVLVTAAGAGPGVAVIKALRNLDRPKYVVGADMSTDAAGRYLANAGITVPPASHEDFVTELLEHCLSHQIEMVIPILEQEAEVCAQAVDRFHEHGVHLAANQLSAIQKANDKKRAAEVCAANDIRQPAMFETPNDAPKSAFPLIGRPRLGMGSRGTVVVDVGSNTPMPRDYVWHQFIEGAEYSIDTWGDPRSDLFVAVPRLRQSIRNGQSVKAMTDADPDLVSQARLIAASFGLTDVSCIQLIRSDSDQHIYFVEANARYGTGVSLSIAAGVAFPELQYLARVSPEDITSEMLEYRSGLRMIRYWEEIFV